MLREISQSGRGVRLVVGRVLLEQEETKALEMSDVQVRSITNTLLLYDR